MILKKYFKKNKFKRKRYTGNIYPAYQHHQSGAISISTHIYVLHISIWTDPTLLSTSDLEVWLVFKRWKQVPQSIVWRVLRTNLISLCCINRFTAMIVCKSNLISRHKGFDIILWKSVTNMHVWVMKNLKCKFHNCDLLKTLKYEVSMLVGLAPVYLPF